MASHRTEKHIAACGAELLQRQQRECGRLETRGRCLRAAVRIAYNLRAGRAPSSAQNRIDPVVGLLAAFHRLLFYTRCRAAAIGAAGGAATETPAARKISTGIEDGLLCLD